MEWRGGGVGEEGFGGWLGLVRLIASGFAVVSSFSFLLANWWIGLVLGSLCCWFLVYGCSMTV